MAYSRGVNQIFLLGRIATDITPIQKDGNAIGCRFNLVVDRPAVSKEKDTARQQTCDYIPCVCWSWVSKHVLEKYSKGMMIFAIGSWQSGSYMGRDGKKVYTNNCVIGEVHDLQNGNNTSGADLRTPYQSNRVSDDVDDIMRDYQNSGNAISPDDLPF